MKKEYITPAIDVLNLDIEMNVLATSTKVAIDNEEYNDGWDN